MADTTNGSDKPSPLEQKIIKQMEYYFGDANLQKDKFLREQIKKDDGWVTLQILCTFNRLKTLSEDYKVICAALNKSTNELLEVNEDCTKIRRLSSKPIPENTAERREELNSRSVYAKGFPLDATLDDIQEFIEKYGEVESIQMRKDQQKQVKGSIFALFKSKESADNFLKEDSLKYGENELKRLLKDDYIKQKLDERSANKEKKKEEKEEQKAQKADEELQEFKERMTVGAILELTDLPKDLSREDMKDIFKEHADIAWIDFDRGDEKACIRFKEEGQAAMAWEKAKEAGEGKVVIKEQEVTGKVLEGDEEIAHWRDIVKQQAESRRNKKNRGRGGSFRGRGHGDRKRRGGGGGPPSKHSKRD